MKRLVKAIPKDLGTVYQRVPGAPDGTLRPNIVILNDVQKKAHLVDVACPYETQSNLKASRERKLSKYAGLKSWLEEKGYNTQLDAFLVGALGTWDAENEPVLRQLRIGRKYATLFRKLC